jgi:hypothetical protein
MGIDALGRLIKLSPLIAEQHQLAVIDCLEVRMFILIRVETNVFFIASCGFLDYCVFLFLYVVRLSHEKNPFLLVYVALPLSHNI